MKGNIRQRKDFLIPLKPSAIEGFRQNNPNVAWKIKNDG